MQQLKDCQPKDLAPGLTGYYAHGERMTLGLVEIKKAVTCRSTNIRTNRSRIFSKDNWT